MNVIIASVLIYIFNCFSFKYLQIAKDIEIKEIRNDNNQFQLSRISPIRFSYRYLLNRNISYLDNYITHDFVHSFFSPPITHYSIAQIASSSFRGACSEESSLSRIHHFVLNDKISRCSAAQFASSSFRGACSEESSLSWIHHFVLNDGISHYSIAQIASSSFRGACSEESSLSWIHHFVLNDGISHYSVAQIASSSFRGACSEESSLSWIHHFVLNDSITHYSAGQIAFPLSRAGQGSELILHYPKLIHKEIPFLHFALPTI